MIIKLTPPQVVTYWELIKFANINGDLVAEDHRQQVLNETLHALLNETAQCFLRLNSERRVMSVMLTRIQTSRPSGEKFLFIQCIFSFQNVSDEEWRDDWKYIQNFAQAAECKYIEAESSNGKIFQLMQKLGARELCRIFKYELN